MDGVALGDSVAGFGFLRGYDAGGCGGRWRGDGEGDGLPVGVEFDAGGGDGGDNRRRCGGWWRCGVACGGDVEAEGGGGAGGGGVGHAGEGRHDDSAGLSGSGGAEEERDAGLVYSGVGRGRLGEDDLGVSRGVDVGDGA